jgi:thiol:disulfide interchange protein
MDTSPRGLILFAIAIAFLVALVPTALNDLFAVDTANWSAAAQSLWVIIPLAVVATLVLIFVPKGKGGKGAS